MHKGKIFKSIPYSLRTGINVETLKFYGRRVPSQGSSAAVILVTGCAFIGFGRHEHYLSTIGCNESWGAMCLRPSKPATVSYIKLFGVDRSSTNLVRDHCKLRTATVVGS